MGARAAPSNPKTRVEPAGAGWSEQVLLFALFFVGLLLLHAPLLRLPYFWDEAGYYVPAARDLYLNGTLIPHSTPSNAHPPLVMAWLASAWRVAGYSPLVARTAIIALAAFSLVGLFRLSRSAANLQVAWATTFLVALYPVFFTQSSMTQVDLPAAGFTFWALLAYLEDQPRKQVLWFSLAALAKETAILAPVALFVWQFMEPRLRLRWPELALPRERSTRSFHLLLPILPLACWFAYHYAKTGFLFGNPEFFRYNVAATLNPLRIPFALAMRFWQITGYLGLYLLTLSAFIAMFRRPENDGGVSRPRIAPWKLAAFAVVLLAYLIFMSVVGGAVLARYLLPILPLVILTFVSTLWRRLRYWKLIVVATVIAFVGGLFINPPYGFSIEDNLAYRDYIVMHAEAGRFLTMRYPGVRVLTAWPASDELSRPWLGYVARPFPVVRIEDFSAAQVTLASFAHGQFDVALVFSTKYQPLHPVLEGWAPWQRIKERFFGYHHDLSPDEIARILGGKVIYHKETSGQWIGVIAFDQGKEQNARLRSPKALTRARDGRSEF